MSILIRLFTLAALAGSAIGSERPNILYVFTDDQQVSINGAKPIDLGGYSVDRHTDLAIDYISERAKGEQPWRS